MSSISVPLPSENSGKMRSVNILRDLPKIADLVELCFQKNMDGEGQRYVQQMRSASSDRPYLQWAASSLPMLGYIWEVDDKIVGNISVVPFSKGNFLLANIAVHPDYRRHGIARKLTERAMNYIRKRGAQNIWLHVEEDNDPAIQLYLSLGFHGKALRTTWNAGTEILDQPQFTPPNITGKIGRFWQQHIRWLDQAYPNTLRWYRMPDFQIFGPGIKYWLYRFFVENDIRQWAVQKDGAVQALLSWMPTGTTRSQLWLATTPQADAASLTALLLHARLHLVPRKLELFIDYPAGQHTEALTHAGFEPQRTLLWMRAPGSE